MSDVPEMREVLGEDAPSNWGKWDPDDELGCLALGHLCYDGKLWNGYDGRWSFFYVATPLKVVRGTGAPVNPVAIR